MDDVLGQATLGRYLHFQIAGFDVDRAATLLGDIRKLGPQHAFVIGVQDAPRAHARGGLHHTA